MGIKLVCALKKKCDFTFKKFTRGSFFFLQIAMGAKFLRF